jgi:hypothetical protein
MSDPVAAWQEALSHAWSLARGERLQRLRGDRIRSFDDRGLHPFSLEVGRIQALQELVPELREAEFDPRALRADAEQVAVREHEEEVALDLGTRMGWITEEQAAAIRTDPEGAEGYARRQKKRPTDLA